MAGLNESTGSYELVLSAVVFGLIGLWLDRRFGTTPWLLIGLSIFGVAGAVASLYYRYKNRIAELQAETVALRTAANKAAANNTSTGTEAAS